MPRPRKYPPALIDRGMRLAMESGRPIAHVADDLGIQRETLRKEVYDLRRANEILNRYGPELLLRLSRGLAPYAIPSATARDISRALRQLGFHGLVARAGRRGWRVADAFLRAALLSTPLSSSTALR